METNTTMKCEQCDVVIDGVEVKEDYNIYDRLGCRHSPHHHSLFCHAPGDNPVSI